MFRASPLSHSSDSWFLLFILALSFQIFNFYLPPLPLRVFRDFRGSSFSAS